jgi:hypothetical protein
MAKGKPTVNKEGGKHAGGRPTPYKPEYCHQAEKLCRLGATDKEMADFFGVVESTINKWKIDHPQFSESLKRGKLLADANVADRLYQRAMGFEHDSEEIKVIPFGKAKAAGKEDEEDEEQKDVESADVDHPNVIRVPIRKIYPPDTTAAIFWLKNRQPKKWRDKVEQGFTNGDGEDVPVVTVFQIPDNGRDKSNKTAGRVSDEGTQQSG